MGISTTAAATDAELSDGVAARLARPKVAAADSFILHAPLEGLARTALLPMVEPDVRDEARARLAWVGETYTAAGEELAPAAPRAYDGVEVATAHLVAAIDAGDLDDADASAAWLAEAVTPVELAALLADDVIPRLSAAAHGSIFLYHLPRVAPRSPAASRALRGLVRELARHPDWRLQWHEQRPRHAGEGVDLVAALRRPRSPGDPGSDFIFPTMALVEGSGLAAEVLDGPTRSTHVRRARRDLLRVAAASMLQDDPAYAPYGWSHCLTMPQAVLGLAEVGAAEPGAAIAVAATFVLGFRATQGSADVDLERTPGPPPPGDPVEALGGIPAEAASAAFHAPDEQVPAVLARLASRAAVHEDAHLAKYTLACVDAMRADPEARRLFLAAAASLGAWWANPT
jgi:hypothetical protein